MVLRRAAKVVGETIDVNTGSSLYSRIGTTHMSTLYFRITAGRTVLMRETSQRCCTSACSRSVPNGRTGDDAWAARAPGRTKRKADRTERRMSIIVLELEPTRPSRFLADVLVEERDRPLPRQLGRGLIVARRRVVVEPVLSARIQIAFVTNIGRLERLLECRPARVDAFVHLGRLDHQRSLDLRDVRNVRRGAVEGNSGGKIVQSRGEVVHHATSVAEAHRADLAG